MAITLLRKKGNKSGGDGEPTQREGMCLSTARVDQDVNLPAWQKSVDMREKRLILAQSLTFRQAVFLC
jgi:hypothetical protein